MEEKSSALPTKTLCNRALRPWRPASPIEERAFCQPLSQASMQKDGHQEGIRGENKRLSLQTQVPHVPRHSSQDMWTKRSGKGLCTGL